MKWQEVRERFPHQWVVLEAMNSHREDDYWVPDELAILDHFEDGWAAMRRYRDLRNQFSQRDIFYFHSDRESLRIQEIHTLGLRL